MMNYSHPNIGSPSKRFGTSSMRSRGSEIGPGVIPAEIMAGNIQAPIREPMVYQRESRAESAIRQGIRRNAAVKQTSRAKSAIRGKIGASAKAATQPTPFVRSATERRRRSQARRMARFTRRR